MEITRLKYGDKLYEKTIDYAKDSSWEAGPHLAKAMENNDFKDWESIFVATEDDAILGFCTIAKEDYYPENRYSPWISNVFVDEKARGKRISQKLIDAAAMYAKEIGFTKIYIPSGIDGLYEKYGFKPIDELKNYGGDIDTIFMREV